MIPWITVGGALGTAAHGTGREQGPLSDQLLSVRLIDGRGTEHVLDHTDPDWGALQCNLGALGVVTEATFRCVPNFRVQVRDDVRTVFAESTFTDRASLGALLTDAEYTSALWWPGTERAWVKTFRPSPDEPTTEALSWGLDQLTAVLSSSLDELVGILKRRPELTPWFTSAIFDQLKHRTFVTDVGAAFHFQTRYPRVWDMSYAFDAEIGAAQQFERAAQAWQVVFDTARAYARQGRYPQNMATHMRFLRGSDAWLSPSHGHTGSVQLEIVTLYDTPDWNPYFTDVENAWLDLGGRPHWGKYYGWGTYGSPHVHDALDRIMAAYPRLPDFRAARDRFDPDRRFANPLIDRILQP